MFIYLNAVRPVSGCFVRFAQTEDCGPCVRLNVWNQHVPGHHRRRVLVHLGAHEHGCDQLHVDAVRRKFVLNGQREVLDVHLINGRGRRVWGLGKETTND